MIRNMNSSLSLLYIGTALLLSAGRLFSQGSLIPPGPPAPSMVTLSQIEPRTPISTPGYVISNSGSYYLTTNLVVTSGDGISIMADNVKLDLNGFTISSTVASPASGFAICLNSGHVNITIANGFIKSGTTYSGGAFTGPGFSWGIAHLGSPAKNVQVSDITVTGCALGGIYIDLNDTSIRNCTADTAGDTCLFASSIYDSTGLNGGNNGIYGDYVFRCTGTSVAAGSGIYARNAYDSNGSTASGTGLYVVNVASSCAAGASGNGTGINAYTANNCLGYVAGSGTAIQTRLANGCSGVSVTGGTGINASAAAINCYGSGFSGISTDEAENCYGQAISSGGAIVADTVQNSYGVSATGVGIQANAVNNSRGVSNGSGIGINATEVSNSRGSSAGSGAGIAATTALNCVGSSSSGDGINTSGSGIAIGCWGTSSSGTGMHTYIGNSSYGPTESVTLKYNMP